MLRYWIQIEVSLMLLGLLLWWGPTNTHTALVGIALLATGLMMFIIGWAIVAWAVISGRASFFPRRPT